MSFLSAHEVGGTEVIGHWKQLESVISTAQRCRGEKQIIQISDNNRLNLIQFATSPNILAAFLLSPSCFYCMKNTLQMSDASLRAGGSGI